MSTHNKQTQSNKDKVAVRKKSVQKKKSTTSKSQKRVPSGDDMDRLVDLTKGLRSKFGREFNFGHKFTHSPANHGGLTDEHVCQGCCDPMETGKAYFTVETELKGTLYYHQRCFYCNHEGCLKPFSTDDPDDMDDWDVDEDDYRVWFDNGLLPHCGKTGHIPSESPFVTPPIYDGNTGMCMNKHQVENEKYHDDAWAFISAYGYCQFRGGVSQKSVEDVFALGHAGVEFCHDSEIKNPHEGPEMGIAKWPGKSSYRIGPFYDPKEDLEKYDDKRNLIGSETTKTDKTSRDLAKLCLECPVTQNVRMWEIRNQIATSRPGGMYTDILFRKEHPDCPPAEVSEGHGGTKNIVAAIGPLMIIPANATGENTGPNHGKVCNIPVELKRVRGAGGKIQITDDTGATVDKKKYPGGNSVGAYTACTTSETRKDGGICIVFCPNQFLEKIPVQKDIELFFTTEELAEHDDNELDCVKTGWHLDDKRYTKRPRREIGSDTDVSLDGEWRTVVRKFTEEKLYDWERFFIEKARKNDRFPSGGVYQDSPFEGLEVHIPHIPGDTIAFPRFHPYVFLEGRRTQMYASTGAYIMDTRKKTAQTRIACALNNFLAASHYNAFGCQHPSAIEGLGALGGIPDDAADCLWNPIAPTELHKYKAALLGTKSSSQKIPPPWTKLQIGEKSGKFAGSSRKLDQNSSLEIVEVPKPTSTKSKKPKGKMAEKVKNPQSPTTVNDDDDLVTQFKSCLTGTSAARGKFHDPKIVKKVEKSKKEEVIDVSGDIVEVEGATYPTIRLYVKGEEHNTQYYDFIFPDQPVDDEFVEAVDEVLPAERLAFQGPTKIVAEPRLTALLGGSEKVIRNEYKETVETEENAESIKLINKFAEATATMLQAQYADSTEIDADDIEFSRIFITSYPNHTDHNRGRREGSYISQKKVPVTFFWKGGAGFTLRIRLVKSQGPIQYDITIPQKWADNGFWYVISPDCQISGDNGICHQIKDRTTAQKAWIDEQEDYEHLRLIQFYLQKGADEKKPRVRKPASKPKAKPADKKKKKKKKKKGKEVEDMNKKERCIHYNALLGNIVKLVGKEEVKKSQQEPKGSDGNKLYEAWRTGALALKKYSKHKGSAEDSRVLFERVHETIEDFQTFVQNMLEEDDDDDDDDDDELDVDMDLGIGDDDSSSSFERKVLPVRATKTVAKKLVKKKATKDNSWFTAEQLVHIDAVEAAVDGDWEGNDDDDDDDDDDLEDLEEEDDDDDDEDEDDEEDDEDDDEDAIGVDLEKKKVEKKPSISSGQQKRLLLFDQIKKKFTTTEGDYPRIQTFKAVVAAREAAMSAETTCEDAECAATELKAFRAAYLVYLEACKEATEKVAKKKAQDDKKAPPPSKKAKTPVKKEKTKTTPVKKTKTPVKKEKTKTTPVKKEVVQKRAREDAEEDDESEKKRLKELKEFGELKKKKDAEEAFDQFTTFKSQFDRLNTQAPPLDDLDESDLATFRAERQGLTELLTKKQFDKHGANIPGLVRGLQDFETTIRRLANKPKKRAREEPIEEEEEEEEVDNIDEEEEDDMDIDDEEEQDEGDSDDEPSTKKSKDSAWIVFGDENVRVTFVGASEKECMDYLTEHGYNEEEYTVCEIEDNQYQVGEEVNVEYEDE